MAKKNKGWDYINSDDINSMSDGSKDDWGYIDSDGSGSFHGGDGSWGYKNPDGSGSYYGSDGSWGYKNTDGSGSFHDADGSWGIEIQMEVFRIMVVMVVGGTKMPMEVVLSMAERETVILYMMKEMMMLMVYK